MADRTGPSVVSVAHYVVFTVGTDRPGIVAAVTGAIVDLGGNLLDTAMTILSGQFAVVLAVDADVEAGVLEARIADATRSFDLDVSVREVADFDGVRGDSDGAVPSDPWVVSVYGADRIGIVAGFTALLAAADVNIVDLHTRRVGDAADPVYAMLLEVELAAATDVDRLRGTLDALAADLAVSVSLHRADAAIL